MGGRSHHGRQLQDALAAVAPGYHVYLLSSARFGLAAAIRQLRLDRPRVAVPAYVCPAVITAITKAGGQPVYVDVEPGSIGYDRAEIEARVSRREVDAIIGANTYGLDQDYEHLNRLSLPVIEDAAYQSGRQVGPAGVPCGLRAPAGVWSFNFKALTAIGGGVLFARSALPELAQLPPPGLNFPMLRRYAEYFLRSVGRARIPKSLPGATPPGPTDFTFVRESLKQLCATRMTELQAALALAQWHRREELFAIQAAHSRSLADQLRLAAGLSLLRGQAEQVMPHLFPVLLPAGKSDVGAAVLAFRQAMHEHSVQTEDTYPILAGKRAEFPNAYDLAERMVLIPCNASLRPADLRQVGTALSAAWKATVRRGFAPGRGTGP